MIEWVKNLWHGHDKDEADDASSALAKAAAVETAAARLETRATEIRISTTERLTKLAEETLHLVNHNHKEDNKCGDG